MKTKLLALITLATGSMFAQTHFSVGVNIGGGYRPAYYAPVPVYQPVQEYYADQPPCPGPGYSWIDGYWSDPGYGRRSWVAGFWRAPVARYRYETPRYDRYEQRAFDRRDYREDRRDFREDRRDSRDNRNNSRGNNNSRDNGYNRNNFRGR